jgi:hypothetical protein
MFNKAPAATNPGPPLRHALGLPAGSVRAILALSILGLLWLIVYKYHGPGTTLPVVFIYLQILMVLILAHYFSAHGHTIGSNVSARSPLGLPGGSVRLLLLLGYGGLTYFLYQNQADFELPPKENFLMLIALVLGGFFLGHYLTMFVKAISFGTLPYWFQDLQAWIALLAMIALSGLVVIHMFINPSVSPEQQVGSLPLDTVLAALVGFYFGSRT